VSKHEKSFKQSTPKSLLEKEEGPMKCYYHPTQEALAVCKSCGKGICQNCLVEISNTSYCKTCVEQGRVCLGDTVGYKQPCTPIGMNKTPFIIGGVGALISGILAIFALIFGFGSVSLFGFSNNYFGVLASVVTPILAVGIILLGLGYRGFRANYGLQSGTGAFALSIVAAVFLLVNVGFGMILSTSYYNYTYSYATFGLASIASIITVISIMMLGVAQIIFGVAHIYSRRFTGNSGLSMATGIIFIVSGALTTSVLLSFIGMVMLLVSGILAFIVFITAKVRQPSQPPQPP
jgi:hypothetical protein